MISTAQIALHGVRVKRASRQRIARLVAVGVAPIFAMYALSSLAGMERFTILCTNPLFLSMVVLLLGIVAPLCVFRRFTVARGAIDVLARAEDPRAVGPLLDALQLYEDSQVSAPAHAALVRLLPTVRPDVADQFTPTQRTTLRMLLRTSAYLTGDLLISPSRRRRDQADLQVAILKALEQIGDGDDLLVVRTLAASSPRTPQGRRVRDAARECVPYLTIRADADQARARLLRPACAGGEAVSALLRPAAHGDSEPEELLHPADLASPNDPA